MAYRFLVSIDHSLSVVLTCRFDNCAAQRVRNEYYTVLLDISINHERQYMNSTIPGHMF